MAEKATLGSTRILVVDDETSVRHILRDFLAFQGYTVELADGAQAALEQILTAPFDLVLTDLEMPGKNGLDLLSELQSLRNPPPAIMMTGYGTVETAIQAMKAGAFDYILKPFQLEELSLLIQKTLEHHRLEADNIRLQQLVALYRVSEELNSAATQEGIAKILTEAAIKEIDPDAFCFWELHTGQWRNMSNWRADGSPADAEAFVNSFDSLSLLKAFHEDEPLLLTADSVGEFFRDPNLAPVSTIVVPMRIRGRVSGMLAAFMWRGRRMFSEANRRSLQIYADRAAVCLENVRLQDHLQQTFLQTINSLVGALEAKDEYTKGHSERVMQWAMIIGQLYGLSEQALGDLRRAALLHDIGKIGLNLDLLNRPGKLSDDEVQSFKLHTLIGKRILEPVDFLQGSIPAVTHHHERWDGNGYPLGLAGKEIPLGARVLAMADSFEVMITDRAYRQALTLPEAKAEIAKSAGTHFDPAIAEKFLAWLDQFSSADELPVRGGRRRGKDHVTELPSRSAELAAAKGRAAAKG